MDARASERYPWASGAAVPLLAATAWSLAALGGARPVDMGLATALVLVALRLTGSSPRDLTRSLLRTPFGIATLAWLTWTIAVGLATAGQTLATLRLPWLAALLVLTALAASRLDAAQRHQATAGLVVIGVVLALSAVAEWVGSALSGEALPIRAASLLGYPNAAGVVMVATSLTTVSMHRAGRLTTAQLAGLVGLQALGVLATGSRLALLASLVCIALVAWRRRSLPALCVAVAASAPFVAVLVQRFVTSRPERIDLWRASLSQVAERPLVGRGPAPGLVLSPSAGGKPTTHSHNELLQLSVEYGLIGLVLTLVILVLLLRTLAGRGLHDPWIALGCMAVASLALTDFGLRIPAVSLTLALLVPLSWGGPSSATRRPATEDPTAILALQRGD